MTRQEALVQVYTATTHVVDATAVIASAQFVIPELETPLEALREIRQQLEAIYDHKLNCGCGPTRTPSRLPVGGTHAQLR